MRYRRERAKGATENLQALKGFPQVAETADERGAVEPTAQSMVRGRVEIRPWRVGLLIEVKDEQAVRDAVIAIAGTRGGYFLPILDRHAAPKDLQVLADRFALDSLYDDDPPAKLEQLLRTPGFSWLGRGEFGPFANQRPNLPVGLLSTTAIGIPGINIEASRSMDLTHLVGWGGELLPPPRGSTPVEAGTSAIVASSRHLRLHSEWGAEPPTGLFVVDEADPATAVAFWNMRSVGGGLRALSPYDGTWNDEVLTSVNAGSGTPGSRAEVLVHGIEALRPAERERLESWATLRGCVLVLATTDWSTASWHFPGVEPVATAQFRIAFDRLSRTVPIPVPRLPFIRPTGHWAGVVGAEVHVHGDERLDPRRTLAIPGTRSHTVLLDPSLVGSAEHLRMTPRGAAFGLQAGAEELLLPIPANLEAFAEYFGSGTAVCTQSEQGRFDTWAAESLGGALSGLLTQPALRAGLELVARTPSGVTMQQLESHVARNQGEWPDRLFASRHPGRGYARAVTHQLLQSDLITPVLDAECTHCRVTSRIEADDVGSQPQCGFCGHRFSLALSHALTKPVWRYRLARHALSERVVAMLPTLATVSTLAQLRHVEGPGIAHVLGLEVKLPGQQLVEVDVAAVLSELDEVVLAEVKSHNRIDDHDVDNLGRLQREMWSRGTESTLLIVTLKDSFSDEEHASLRRLAELNARMSTARSSPKPMVSLPLLWTRRDISLPWGDEHHPWRRAGARSGGLFAMAEASVRLHLGLDVISIPSMTSGTEGLAKLNWLDG